MNKKATAHTTTSLCLSAASPWFPPAQVFLHFSAIRFWHVLPLSPDPEWTMTATHGDWVWYSYSEFAPVRAESE